MFESIVFLATAGGGDNSGAGGRVSAADGFVEFLDGAAELISIILNEVFSWYICGLNVGALVVFCAVISIIVLLIWG